jgi:hypothetical protein
MKNEEKIYILIISFFTRLELKGKAEKSMKNVGNIPCAYVSLQKNILLEGNVEKEKSLLSDFQHKSEANFGMKKKFIWCLVTFQTVDKL